MRRRRRSKPQPISTATARRRRWRRGIPVGSETGVTESRRRAVVGAEREQRERAGGNWVAHWKIVRIIRPVWDKAGEANQSEPSFPGLARTRADADALTLLEPAPPRPARDIGQRGDAQCGNAFDEGSQAAVLKPADFFGNDDVRYLMEDMATDEIGLNILWEWPHDETKLNAGDEETSAKKADPFSDELFTWLVVEEYEKPRPTRAAWTCATTRKKTTLPLARTIVDGYTRSARKGPWMIDLLNINLGVEDEVTAQQRTREFLDTFAIAGVHITRSLDFEEVSADGSNLVPSAKGAVDIGAAGRSAAYQLGRT